MINDTLTHLYVYVQRKTAVAGYMITEITVLWLCRREWLSQKTVALTVN